MFQKYGRQDDDELDLSGEPPRIEIDDGDEGVENTPARSAAPSSTRASRAAAERARKRAPEKKVTRTSTGASKNPYRTRSAAEIRAEREVRRKRSLTDLTDEPRPRRVENVLDNAKIAELLHNPTRQVTEAELRAQYAYVLKDLRNMAVLTLGLVIVLFTLAAVLPR